MARELSIINEELRQNFMNNANLADKYGFTAGAAFEDEFSIVSFEAIFFFIVAFSIWTMEKIFDDHKEWMTVKESQMQPWNLPSLVTNAKKFQLGDTLVFQDDKYKYAIENEALKRVKLAAANEVGNIVVLKVATMNSANEPEPLLAPDFTAFQSYIKRFKPPGVKLSCVNRPADTLKIYFRVYVDPLVLNASGELLTDTSVKPVEIAIQEYCKGLDFNGVFDITKLTDKIQGSTGVLNPVFESAAAKYGLGSYAAITDYYIPNAGYLKIDPAFPLTATITYILP